MSNTEKITRSQFKKYMDAGADKFVVADIDKFKTKGEGGYLGYLQPDGKSTKRVFIDCQREMVAPWGIGKQPESGKPGVTFQPDDELKQFTDFIDDSIINQLADRSEALFGKKMDAEKVSESYTRMVHATYSKEKKSWGQELLRLGVVMPGMSAKDGPLKLIDVDGEAIDVNKYMEDADGSKHAFQGVPVFNPMFVWVGDKAATGCKTYARKIVHTGDLEGGGDITVDVDPELIAVARKRKAEAAAAVSAASIAASENTGGNEDHHLGIDASPPAKRAAIESTEASSPGWS